MPTELLAVGTTAASSTDLVVEAGEPVTVCLKDAAGPRLDNAARVHIEIKDDDGQYIYVETLTGSRPALVLFGAGTYRCSRQAGASCGVFSG